MAGQRPPRDWAKRLHAAHLTAIADQVTERALQVTTPVYQDDDRGKPAAIGTAVLLAIDTIPFLVTAAHVLDCRHEKPLAVQAGKELLTVTGDVTRLYDGRATNIHEDHVDNGIVRLAGARWEAVSHSAFADWAELDHSSPVMTRDSFALLGYPLTKQRNILKGTQLEARAYRVAGLECLPNVYQARGYDFRVSLAFGFDKNRTWGPGGRTTAPDLEGISGGGVWRFERRLHENPPPPVLSGIAVEWQKRGEHRHVLATRIQAIIAGIVNQYPDVGEIIGRISR